VTRRAVEGGGSAAYVSTRLGAAGLAPLLGTLLDRAGVGSELPADARGRVELTIRHHDGGEYWFLTNRTDAPVGLPGLVGPGDEVLACTGAARQQPAGTVQVPARGVLVLRRPAVNAS
jgi:beta-galactosidase